MQFQDILEELEKERGIFDVYMVRGSSSHRGMGMGQDHMNTPEPLGLKSFSENFPTYVPLKQQT